MERPTFGTILKLALVSGILAGLVAAMFHFALTEPVIEAAITMEEQMSHADGEAEPALVTREMQRVGLFIGFMLYGVVWSLFLSVALALWPRSLMHRQLVVQVLLTALLGYWTLGLFPFLKYPANPPGVGDPESINYRQTLYIGFLVLSVAGSALALIVGRFMARRGSAPPVSWLAGAAVLGLFSGVVYVVMPANPDAIRMPLSLVEQFRILSLVGITIFWGALGIALALLLRRHASARGTALVPRPA